ncbi:MAG: hypothetical protein GWO04_16165, partial [Actinobacteria bacterium]|nr:hypothetical protein [Actinomycetota bacterium]NIV87218.1 hypothetical protein [Actinomycetota bacterium]
MIQGHRGARGLRPENTLPAFETALDLGVGTLELDLHLSVDGVVVVWHDPVIDPAKCGAVTGSQPAPPDPDDPDTTEDELRVSALAIDELRGYRCGATATRTRTGSRTNPPIRESCRETTTRSPAWTTSSLSSLRTPSRTPRPRNSAGPPRGSDSTSRRNGFPTTRRR